MRRCNFCGCRYSPSLTARSRNQNATSKLDATAVGRTRASLELRSILLPRPRRACRCRTLFAFIVILGAQRRESRGLDREADQGFLVSVLKPETKNSWILGP